jgi:hypothetical protein
MVRWLWFGRPVRGLPGGGSGCKPRHCASLKSLRLTPATWPLRAGFVPLRRHAVGAMHSLGGTATGIEAGITDHEAVNGRVAHDVQEGAASMSWPRMQEAVAVFPSIRRRAALIRRCCNSTAMNLFGTVYTVNAVSPTMKEQRSGKIITVASVAGTAPSRDGGYAHYGARSCENPDAELDREIFGLL